MKHTQWARITLYLHEHDTASVRELVLGCNINSPRKRISEMIEAGVPIKSFWDESVDEYGDRTRFKRYYMG